MLSPRGFYMYSICCFVSVVFIYGVLSWMSYNKTARESWIMFPASVFLSALSATIWVMLIRHLDESKKIAAASLVWDILITIIYAVIPMLLIDKRPSLQAFIYLFIAVAAVLAFKSTQ